VFSPLKALNEPGPRGHALGRAHIIGHTITTLLRIERIVATY
jgi:hypothetical protein